MSGLCLVSCASAQLAQAICDRFPNGDDCSVSGSGLSQLAGSYGLQCLLHSDKLEHELVSGNYQNLSRNLVSSSFACFGVSGFVRFRCSLFSFTLLDGSWMHTHFIILYRVPNLL